MGYRYVGVEDVSIEHGLTNRGFTPADLSPTVGAATGTPHPNPLNTSTKRNVYKVTCKGCKQWIMIS